MGRMILTHESNANNSIGTRKGWGLHTFDIAATKLGSSDSCVKWSNACWKLYDRTSWRGPDDFSADWDGVSDDVDVDNGDTFVLFAVYVSVVDGAERTGCEDTTADHAVEDCNWERSDATDETSGAASSLVNWDRSESSFKGGSTLLVDADSAVWVFSGWWWWWWSTSSWTGASSCPIVSCHACEALSCSSNDFTPAGSCTRVCTSETWRNKWKTVLCDVHWCWWKPSRLGPCQVTV